jgi:hypothetical protein
MQVIKQIITIPDTRELRIKLPEDAMADEQAEVIILFQSSSSKIDERVAAMREAAADELYLADLHQVSGTLLSDQND